VDFTAPQSARYLAGHDSIIHAITVSADGLYVLSSSEDETVRLWDVHTTECLQTLLYQNWLHPNLLGLSADASRAVLGFEYLDDEATLKLWDVKAGQSLRDFEMPMTYGRAECIYSISMSPDGKYVLAGGERGAVQLWDVDTGKSVRTFDGLWGYVRFVQFSPDGTRFFAANSCQVTQFDVNTGECLRTLKIDEDNYDKIARITVSADGSYALYGSEHAELKLWEIKTGRCVRTFQDLTKDVHYTFGGSYEAFTSINLSPDGKYSLSGTRGGTYKLRRFDPEYHAPLMLSRITPTEQAIENQIAAEESLALARKALAEERFIEAANHVKAARSVSGYERWGDAVELWTSLYARLPRTQLKASWHSHEVTRPDLAHSISFSADAKYVLFGGPNMELKEVATGESLRIFDKPRDGNAALSGDARLAMIGGWDHYELWDMESGKLIEKMYSSHEQHVEDIKISVDGRYAVMCTDDSFRVWSIGPEGMKCTLAIKVDWGDLSAVAISSDSKYCVAGTGFSSLRDNDYRLRLWDVDSGECQTFEGYDSGTYTLVFAPDSKHFLGAGFDGKLRLWDIATGACVRFFEGHTQPVDSVDISSDGKFALSGGRDRTLRMWNMATGECVRTWEIKTGFIDPVRFSSDCKYVLAGTASRTVKVELLDWELEDREPSD
jgi:WD40 repeat protein